MKAPEVNKPTASQPAATPQKPSLPENRVIKEGREPRTVAKK